MPEHPKRGDPQPDAASGPHGHAKSATGLLTLGALGVVYGDIGTSPLYALRESFESSAHELEVIEPNILGVLSLTFWSLMIVITVKYLIFVMRADNEGEGGILALTSLVAPKGASVRGRRVALVLIGLFGTALLYGDGIITPAISVLSAVEGTEVATSRFESWVIPVSIAILIALFAIQRKGTATIGRVFGPIMVIWFITIAALGLPHIIDHPEIFKAVNPFYGVRFFRHNGFHGFLSLGSIFLVVTGGEALYADMGHFGPKPIRIGWVTLVLPSLLLCYFGQGALLLGDPGAIDNPFYRLAPEALLVPLVVLATFATVIASQALISGAFSLTMQAVQLGYIPRVKIKHTSASAFGQIYIGTINWAMMIACIGLVIGFRSSTNLAAAYGLAVTATMVITTVLLYVVLRERFEWNAWSAGVLCSFFLIIDVGFLAANLFKIPDGGWFPLVVAAIVFTLMTTWRTGRQLVAARIHRGEILLTDLMDAVGPTPIPRVPGVAIFLFSTPRVAPPALIANLRYNKVLHDRTYILSITTQDVPRVAPEERSQVIDLGSGVKQIILNYGFMEEPNARLGLTEGAVTELGIRPENATYFLGAESLNVTEQAGMARWREQLFTVMSRNTTRAARFFNLPSDRTVEVGIQVDL
ncbi:MAG: KUP/HAK/KT family potassium transporter [Acidimicrobiales bacterium]